MSLCGFRSTGFMWIEGATPQAIACSHCARPISPPPDWPGRSATAALFDMFCGLNGRTLMPRFLAARQSPATSTVLPTSEPVPCSMIARAIASGPLPDRAGDGRAGGERSAAPEIEGKQRLGAGAHGVADVGGMVDNLARRADTPVITAPCAIPCRMSAECRVPRRRGDDQDIRCRDRGSRKPPAIWSFAKWPRVPNTSSQP